MEALDQKRHINGFSCELEDWFHILDSDQVPGIQEWSGLPLRAESNVDRLLELLDVNDVKATFFCLGWMAERMPGVVRRCRQAGHEIGSHGYAHVLAYEIGPKGFLNDIVRAKNILEDLTGEEVQGFRSPGFCVKEDNRWVFDVVAEAGYRYDASVFPARHGHGGLLHAEPGPHVIETHHGSLVEIPTSTVPILGRRVCLFGGGYLRLAPLPLIHWGVTRLHQAGQPLIIYIHPREIDPDHPRLPLRLTRRFKCYVNLRSTLPKLKWLCEHYEFGTMKTIADRLAVGCETRPVEVATGLKETGPAVVSVGYGKGSVTSEKIHSS